MNRAKKIILLCLCCLLLNAARAQYATGCLFDSARAAQIAETAPLTRGNYELPATASLKAYCPAPQDQGAYGTCTAWSVAYASRTILMAQRKKITDSAAIAKIAFSPSYVYNQIRLTNDCYYGAYIADALELVKKEGCLGIAEFGYDCGKAVSSQDKQKAKNNIIRDYKRLFMFDGKSKPSAVLLKKSLSEGKPVVVSMRCFASLERAREVWNPVSNDVNKGYHAMTVIGYDDSRFGGAFEIMNSWGTKWGNRGFTWIRYQDFEKNCMEAYELSDVQAEALPQQLLMAGEMVFKKSDGSLMPAILEGNSYRMKEGYYAGTSFQFFVSHLEPVYLYVIGTDLSGKCSLLFPYSKNISPFLSYKKGTVAFPGEDYYVQLDSRKGTDFICALYSQKALDIQSIIAKMELQKGDIHDRLRAALSLPATGIEYHAKGQIGFKLGKTTGQSVVPLVISIEHQ